MMMFKKYLQIAILLYAILTTVACSQNSSSPPTKPALSASAQSQIDQLIKTFMIEHGITAASITIMHGTRDTLYDKSYGYQNRAFDPVVKEPMMVTGSLVKLVTAAAIQKLAVDGVLSLTDRVFCSSANPNESCWLTVMDVNGNPFYSFAPGPANYGDIQIQNLINHSGGFDRSATSCQQYNLFQYINVNGIPVLNTTPCDIWIQEPLIQNTLGLGSKLPTQMNDIYYWTKNNPLNFVPGSQQVYSNFGYMLLAAIVAKASAMDYGSYVYKNILGPIGVPLIDFQLFSFSPAINSQQYLRTPNAITGVECLSIYPNNKGAAILATEQGCINSINWFGVSTSLATSQAMARVAANFKIDTVSSLDGPQSGVPLNGSTNYGTHYGIVPGVSNLLRQLTSGSSYALMFNKDNNSVTSTGEWQNTLYPKIDAIITNAGF